MWAPINGRHNQCHVTVAAKTRWTYGPLSLSLSLPSFILRQWLGSQKVQLSQAPSLPPHLPIGINCSHSKYKLTVGSTHIINPKQQWQWTSINPWCWNLIITGLEEIQGIQKNDKKLESSVCVFCGRLTSLSMLCNILLLIMFYKHANPLQRKGQSQILLSTSS